MQEVTNTSRVYQVPFPCLRSGKGDGLKFHRVVYHVDVTSPSREPLLPAVLYKGRYKISNPRSARKNLPFRLTYSKNGISLPDIKQRGVNTQPERWPNAGAAKWFRHVDQPSYVYVLFIKLGRELPNAAHFDPSGQALETNNKSLFREKNQNEDVTQGLD